MSSYLRDQSTTRRIRTFTLLVGASGLIASCAAAGRGGHATLSLTSCELSGEVYAGSSRETVCAIFADALAAPMSNIEANGESISLSLEALDRHRAHARLLRMNGAEIATLNFAITDATLSEAAWRRFATDFANHIARSAAD